MRDVSNITANVAYTRFREKSTSGFNGPWAVQREDAFVSSDCPLLKRARSEIEHSDFYSPTYYRAYDLEVTPGSVNTTTEPKLYVGWGQTYWYRYRYQGSWYPDVKSLLDVELWPAVPDHVRDRARNQLLQDLVDQQVNLANNLGELRSNATMMGSTLLRLVRAYRAFKRGEYWTVHRELRITMVRGRPRRGRQRSMRYHRRNWREIRDHLGIDGIRTIDTLRDQWLAYRFGWAPLMSDLWNLRSAVLSSLEEQKSELSVYRNVSEPRELRWENTNYSYRSDMVDGLQTKYWFRVDDETIQGLNALGFQNPLSLAWELAPYSFVVDWFFGVSNFLSGLSAPLGLTCTRGYETYYTKGTIHVSDPDIDGMIPAKAKVFNFQRVPQSIFPRPTPRVRLGLDTNQVATSVALLSQRL